MEVIISILIFLLLFVPMVYISAYTWYMRYVYNYWEEIENYLQSKHWELIEIRDPRSADWESAPFKKPPIFKISFIQIKFMGRLMGATDEEYKVIWLRKNSGDCLAIWLQISFPFLSKPQLNFRKETKKRTPENVLYQNNIIFVQNQCPACGSNVGKEAHSCKECGLHFG